MTTSKIFLPLAALIFPVSAQAQDAGDASPAGVESRETVFDGDFITVGLAGGVSPTYEGSDNYEAFPAGVIIGSYRGVSFQTRGPGINIDLVPDSDDSRIGIIAGPAVRVRMDRTGDNGEAAVNALGDRDTAVEVGVEGGISISQLLSPFDTLSVSTEARWDVAGAHGGRVIQPRLSYSTPLSMSTIATLGVSAEHVDDDYADYYFTVTPAGAAASGLSPFQAKGGWKNVGANLFVGIDLNGDVTDGGFGLFLVGSYSKLLEDAKRSPITSEVGSADQWTGIAGIGYTF